MNRKEQIESVLQSVCNQIKLGIDNAIDLELIDQEKFENDKKNFVEKFESTYIRIKEHEKALKYFMMNKKAKLNAAIKPNELPFNELLGDFVYSNHIWYLMLKSAFIYEYDLEKNSESSEENIVINTLIQQLKGLKEKCDNQMKPFEELEKIHNAVKEISSVSDIASMFGLNASEDDIINEETLGFVNEAISMFGANGSDFQMGDVGSAKQFINNFIGEHKDVLSPDRIKEVMKNIDPQIMSTAMAAINEETTDGFDFGSFIAKLPNMISNPGMNPVVGQFVSNYIDINETDDREKIEFYAEKLKAELLANIDESKTVEEQADFIINFYQSISDTITDSGNNIENAQWFLKSAVIVCRDEELVNALKERSENATDVIVAMLPHFGVDPGLMEMLKTIDIGPLISGLTNSSGNGSAATEPRPELTEEQRDEMLEFYANITTSSK